MSLQKPSAKNQFATDVCIKIDIPIFVTSKAETELDEKQNMRDKREKKMVNVQWKVFHFHQRIAQLEQNIVFLVLNVLLK